MFRQPWVIVTELVINALKHASRMIRWPIKVDYHSQDQLMLVSDNGVECRARNVKPGLGTSIVHALSAQLHALSGQ